MKTRDGQSAGGDEKWVCTIINQVGNYGESLDRKESPLEVERGLNKLWTQGGVQDAPPIR